MVDCLQNDFIQKYASAEACSSVMLDNMKSSLECHNPFSVHFACF